MNLLNCSASKALAGLGHREVCLLGVGRQVEVNLVQPPVQTKSPTRGAVGSRSVEQAHLDFYGSFVREPLSVLLKLATTRLVAPHMHKC